MDLFAFDDAAKHFERALTALDHGGGTCGASPMRDDARRADLLWRLGFSQIQLGRTQIGRETCERSAVLAIRIGEAEICARAALAFGSEPVWGRTDTRLVELLQSALTLGTGNETLRVRVMAHLVAAMAPSPSREKIARDAVLAARTLGEPRILAEVISAVRAAFDPADDLDERIALDRELAALTATLGDNSLIFQTYSRLALDAIQQGDAAAAQAELRIQRQLADETRVPQYQLRAACMQLMWATLEGDAENIASAEQDVRELSERVDEMPGMAVLAYNRYVRAVLCGDDVGQVAAAELVEIHLSRGPMSGRLRSLWRAAALAPDPNRHDEARARLMQYSPEGPHLGLGATILGWVHRFSFVSANETGCVRRTRHCFP